nr:MFS transporter [uncultured Methanobrevibacter sp.]
MKFNLSNINWKSQATWVLLLTSLLHFTCSFTANFITVLLPDISVDLDVPVETLNWITLIFLIAIIAITIPASKNIKRFDLKKSIRILIFLLIVGLVLSAITPNMEVFLFSRLIQGASIALLPTIDLVIIVLAMPKEDVGKALGIVGSAGYVGMTIAPSVTGFVSNLFHGDMHF